MVHIRVYCVNERTLKRYKNYRCSTHLMFMSRALYNKAVELGFDKEDWEKRNNNKVLIEGETDMGTTLGEAAMWLEKVDKI